MGHRHSRPRPPIYPPNDPFFVQIGCTGLRINDYTSQKLDQAPFLYFKIKTRNYNHLFRVIISILSIINPANAGNTDLINNIVKSTVDPSLFTPTTFNAMQNEGTDTKSLSKTSKIIENAKTAIYNINNISDSRYVYGPIYLLTAYNQKDNYIESYLYFPSMTKDMKPWNNYNTLGMNHGWMYSILYKYRYLPYSSCSIRTGTRLPDYIYNKLNDLNREKKLKDPDETVNVIYNNVPIKQLPSDYINANQINTAFEHGFKLGCVTSDFDNNNCYQSDAVHRGMGIYRDGLNWRAYPSVYYTTYMLNKDDKRISNYINRNSFSNLQRNILVEGIDIYPGCTFMLISPNQKYYLALGDVSLILFYNTEGVDLYEYCFNKRTPKNKVPINGKIFQNCKITRGTIEGGYLNLYGISDFDEESVEELLFTLLLTKDLSFDISVVLTDKGELNIMNNNNKLLNTINISTGFKPTKKNIGSRNYLYSDRFNVDEDYKQRLVNLIMYLKERGVYNNDPFYSYLTGEKDEVPESKINQETTGATSQKQTQEYNYRSDIPRFNSGLNYLERYDQYFNHLRTKYNTDSYKLNIINTDAIKYRPGGEFTEEDKNSIIGNINLDSMNSFENNPLYSGSNLVFKDETPEDRAKRLDDEAAESKKKYDASQEKRGNTEDSLFTLNTSNIGSGSSILPQNERVNAENYEQIYNGGSLRLVQLNDYYRVNNPNFIDYFKLQAESQIDGINTKTKATPSTVYNYDSDRNSRIALLDKI